MRIRAKVSIQGTKPLLFHTFPIDTLSEGKSKSGRAGNSEEEWKSTVLMDEHRHLYILGTYPLRSIISGGKEIKVGKGSLMKKVQATLEVEETKIFLNGLTVPDEDQLLKLDTEAVYLDVRSVVNPATKGRNLRYRIAAKAGWTCNFHITWDDSFVSRENIKTCLENSGVLSGLGDGRTIGFGKYKIIAFEMTK